MKWIWTVAFVLASSCTFAADHPPKIFQDKGKKSLHLEREFLTRSPVGTGLGYSISCHAKLLDSFFGYLDDAQFFTRKLPFNLVCYASNDSIVGGGAISRDAKSGKWVRNVSKLVKSSGVDWTSEEIREQEMAIRVYSLKIVNAEGYAYTIDDLTGDEKERRRLLRYCLIRPPKALCGQGEMGYLKDGPKADLTEYALRILRSIEFLEDETSLSVVDAPEEAKTTPEIPLTK
jgi:hypothetical protein